MDEYAGSDETILPPSVAGSESVPTNVSPQEAECDRHIGLMATATRGVLAVAIGAATWRSIAENHPSHRLRCSAGVRSEGQGRQPVVGATGPCHRPLMVGTPVLSLVRTHAHTHHKSGRDLDRRRVATPATTAVTCCLNRRGGSAGVFRQVRDHDGSDKQVEADEPISRDPKASAASCCHYAAMVCGPQTRDKRSICMQVRGMNTRSGVDLPQRC